MRSVGPHVLMLGLASVAAGQGAPVVESLRSAAVIVVASGIDPSSSVRLSVQGTGFFISRSGYLVTARHLRTQLGAVDDGTVSYEVLLGEDGNAGTVQAGYQWEDPTPNGDALVLFANIGGRNVGVLARGPNDPRATGVVVAGITPIYAGGYPKDIGFSVRPGTISAWGVRAPVPMWTTNMSFKEGMSGAPICLEDARVIALAKGNDDADPTTGIVLSVRIIPAMYWDE